MLCNPRPRPGAALQSTRSRRAWTPQPAVAAAAGRSEAPPGPRGLLPWVGPLPTYLRTQKQFFKQITQWADEYGGLYRFTLLGQEYVVVTDPNLVPRVVGRGGKGLPKAPVMSGWDPLLSSEPGVTGLFSHLQTNETWSAVRKAMAPAFTTEAMREAFPSVLALTERFVALVGAVGGMGSGAADVNDWSKRYTLDVLGAVALGQPFGALEDPDCRLTRLIETGLHELKDRSQDPARVLFPFLFASRAAAGDAAIAEFHAICSAAASDAVARGDAAPPGDGEQAVWAQLWRLARGGGRGVDPSSGRATEAAIGPAAAAGVDASSGSGGQNGMSQAQLAAEVATLIVDGYETTANCLTWAMLCVAAEPGAQEAIVAELTAAGIMRGGARDPGRPLSFDDLSRLPWLDAVLLESMQLHAAAPNGTIRAVSPADAAAGFDLNGYKPPTGATVWVPFHALHRGRSNWPDPDSFRPKRWFEDQPHGLDPSASPFGSLSQKVEEEAAAAAAGNGGSREQHQQHAAAAQEVRQTDSSSSSGGGSSSSGSGCPFRFGSRSGSKEVAASAPRRWFGAAKRGAPFMPFSDGARRCIGQPLALLELWVALVELVAAFDLRLAPETGGRAGAEARQRATLTLEPEGGLWLALAPRRAAGRGAGGEGGDAAVEGTGGAAAAAAAAVARGGDVAVAARV